MATRKAATLASDVTMSMLQLLVLVALWAASLVAIAAQPRRLLISFMVAGRHSALLWNASTWPQLRDSTVVLNGASAALPHSLNDAGQQTLITTEKDTV